MPVFSILKKKFSVTAIILMLICTYILGVLTAQYYLGNQFYGFTVADRANNLKTFTTLADSMENDPLERTMYLLKQNIKTELLVLGDSAAQKYLNDEDKRLITKSAAQIDMAN